MTLKDHAINLIKPYVLRGDGYGSLKSSYLGYRSKELSVSIGGYCGEKKISSEKIIVTIEKEGKEEHQIFSLKELYDEIDSNQLKLC